jgi:hypothetical protein
VILRAANLDSLTSMETLSIATMKLGRKSGMVPCFEEPHRIPARAVSGSEREGEKKKIMNTRNNHLGF